MGIIPTGYMIYIECDNMNTINIEDFHDKLKDQNNPPNGVIKDGDKPLIVWAEYNNRTYYWELIE